MLHVIRWLFVFIKLYGSKADIKNFLMEEYPDESFNKATLDRTLNRWGFEFGQGVRSQHLKEAQQTF
jgi:hypothetical protein